MRTDPYAIDAELRARLDRLTSCIHQASEEVNGIQDSARRAAGLIAINGMKAWLDEASAPEMETPARIAMALRIDAELCLWEPHALLKADRIRLEDRLSYRLKETPRKAWLELLKTFDQAGSNETAYRQLLRRLTFELAESAEAFNRQAAEQSQALSNVLLWALGIIIVLVIAFVWQLRASLELIHEGTKQADIVRNFKTPVICTLLISGSIGAMVFVVRSMITEEKVRSRSIKPLLLNMFIRIALGAVYAIAVVFGMLANILPVKTEENTLLMFVVVAAIGAGVSDKLFGEVVTDLIGDGKKKPKKESD